MAALPFERPAQLSPRRSRQAVRTSAEHMNLLVRDNTLEMLRWLSNYNRLQPLYQAQRLTRRQVG